MHKLKQYSDSGGKGNIILLLHGFPSSHTYWNSTQESLGRHGYRVISVDLLGFGNAPKPKGAKYDYNDHIEHVLKALKDLGVKKPVSIVGHSMGGLLAARFGVVHPNRVDKLVLLHPPLYDSSDQAHKTIHDTGRLYRFILTSRFRNLAWQVLRPLSLFIVGKHTSLSRERSFKKIVLGGEIFRDLDNLKKPTLLLVGSHDRPQYLSNLKSHRVSNFIELRIEDVGHHSAIFHRQLVRRAILDFLKD